MRLQSVAGALALAGLSAAFSDSSPWVLLSTSPFNDSPSSDQLQAVSQVLKYTKDILATCPTERYLVVTQPGTNAADLQGPKGCTMPHLCRAVEDSRAQGKFFVSEVVGEAASLGLPEYIKAACAQKGRSVVVDEVELTSLSGTDRAGALGENDGILGQSLETTTAGDSYTILFYSTQGERTTYESDFMEPVRMDLKRDIEGAPFRRQDNDTLRRNLPLFEKYQFFTPGIFMGIITGIILLSILGVGLKALASLEVSYGAFEKDMGPAAQKKQ